MVLKNEVNFIDLFSKLDYIVFFIVIILTIASVIYGQLRKKNAKESESMLDLLIMGRQLTMPMFVATLVATWYGGIFGVTKIAFNQGVYNFITQGAFWYVSYIIFAIFLIKKITPYKAVTLPDLVEKMFGPKSAKLTAIFNFFNVLPIAYTISVGIFLQLILGGSLIQNMVIGSTFVVLYSMWGGLRAVIFSDLIQFFVMCAGVAIILITSMNTFGGINFLKGTLPESYFSLTGTNTIFQTLAWGFIALSTLVDPNFYQRCFAAVSEKAARNGILLSTFIWFIFDICTTFGAMYARALIPEADPAQAYLTYAVQILPDGVRGFILAGVLATILSTLDSYLFLAGTTLSYDLAPKRYKGKTALHHLGVCSVAILSVIMAVSFQGDIKTVWKTLGSYSASCLLLPVLYGYIFPKNIKDLQFVITCLLGVCTTTYWRLTVKTGFWADIDELYIGMITTLLTLSVFTIQNHKSSK